MPDTVATEMGKNHTGRTGSVVDGILRQISIKEFPMFIPTGLGGLFQRPGDHR
jgi:hypothetical protein